MNRITFGLSEINWHGLNTRGSKQRPLGYKADVPTIVLIKRILNFVILLKLGVELYDLVVRYDKIANDNSFLLDSRCIITK